MPEVSIIVPVYNRASSICFCLESLNAMHYRDFEVIVVDDGSSDDTPRIYQEFCNSHSQFRYIQQNNGGVSSARNLGMSKAHGTWITFVDSDDAVRSEHLDIVQMEENVEIDWLIESFTNLYKKQTIQDAVTMKPLSYERFETFSPVKYFFTTFTQTDTPMFSVCGKFYKRENCINYQIRFREDIHLGEDQIFNLDYLRHVKRLVHYPMMCTYIQIDRLIDGKGKRLSSKILPLEEYYHVILNNYNAFRTFDKQAEGCNIAYSVNNLVNGMVTLTLVNYSRHKHAKILRTGELLTFIKNKVKPLFQTVLPYKKNIKDRHIVIIYSLIVSNHCQLAIVFCRLYSWSVTLCLHINRLFSR